MFNANTVDLRGYKRNFLSSEEALLINSNSHVLYKFIVGLPKAKLHIHIEGTLEPVDILAISKLNDFVWNLERYVMGSDDVAWYQVQKSKQEFWNL